jgi:hypothetical protein
MPKKGKPLQPSTRFTADEIVRAIEAVERAGLQIRNVEITSTGSILITTGPHSAAEASGMDEALPLRSKK